jgi:hypothetical protein
LHSLFVLSCRSTLVQVAALEACAKEKEKAEKQIEELMKKLAKFEKDMAVGAEVCNAHSLPIVQYSNTFSFKLCSLVVNGVRSTHEGTLSGEYVRKTVFWVKVGVCLCNIHAEERFFFAR